MAAMGHSKALAAVLTAGTLWSFGALTIRYMKDPQDYRWQYLFFRGLTVAAILCVYLMARDRHRFVENFQKIGLSGIVGAWAWWGRHLFYLVHHTDHGGQHLVSVLHYSVHCGVPGNCPS